MKGEITSISELTEEYNQKEYQILIISKKKPNLKLGEVEVNQ